MRIWALNVWFALGLEILGSLEDEFAKAARERLKAVAQAVPSNAVNLKQ